LSHTVHLFAIVALVEIAYGGDYLQLGDIAGGSVIYLFIIWIGLFSIYFENALKTDALHYWLYVLLGVGLFLLRVGAFWDKRINA
jgi:hypothetical protein